MPRYSEGFRYRDGRAFGRWQLPAATLDDVWAGFPSWVTAAADPVRDAIAAGLAEVFNAVASAAASASVGHLRSHARGWRLDLVAAAAGLTRLAGEREDELRARIPIVGDVVSPNAVRAAVLAIRPDAIVMNPARHAFFAGRTALGRPPIDYAATRRALLTDRVVFFDVGPARVWDSHLCRVHVAIPTGTNASPVKPLGAWAPGRAGGIAAPSTAWAVTLADTLHRVTGSGIRWSASLEPIA